MSESIDKRIAAPLSEDCIALFDTFSLSQPQWTEDQLARFRIWISNLGVFEIGHASIDYRLRDHPGVYSLITKQLEVLKINLEKLNSSEIELTQPQIKGKGTRKSQSFDIDGQAFVYDSPSSETSSSSSEPEVVPSGRSKPSSDLQVVEDTIARLNALSVAIRRAGKQSRTTKADSYEIFEDIGHETINRTREFQKIAAVIVKRDIPDTAPFLQDRLIVSVARRRNRFLYWRRHQMPSGYLKKALSPAQVQMPSATPQANNPHSASHDERNQSGTRDSRTNITGLTATTFNAKEFQNPSASVRGSIKTTGSVRWKAREEFPRQPKPKAKESHFVCPICLINSPAKEAHGDQWIQHVTRDLKPYICILEGCKTPQTVFETFKEWIEHIKEEQMIFEWFCSSNTHLPMRFNNLGLFETHMRQQHADGFQDAQFPSLSDRNKRFSSEVFSSCPFCAHSLDKGGLEQSSSLKDQEQLQYHISRHLLSLAFVSLPPLSAEGSLHSDSEESSTVAIDSWIHDSETMEPLTFDDGAHDPNLMDPSIEEAAENWNWWYSHRAKGKAPGFYDDSSNVHDHILRHLSDMQQKASHRQENTAADTSNAQKSVFETHSFETASKFSQDADLTEVTKSKGDSTKAPATYVSGSLTFKPLETTQPPMSSVGIDYPALSYDWGRADNLRKSIETEGSRPRITGQERVEIGLSDIQSYDLQAFKKYKKLDRTHKSEYTISERTDGAPTQGKGKGVSQDHDHTEPSPRLPRYISGTPGSIEDLNPSYAMRNRDWKKFFLPGRVFSTIWTHRDEVEATKSEDEQFMSEVTYFKSSQTIRSKIRRFVVVRLGSRSSTCLPVTTYDGRGYRQRGINLQEHGLIYSERMPKPVVGMKEQPLHMIPSKGADKLVNRFYVNYGRVYTVECNVKVKDVGQLDRNSIKLLRKYFKEVHYSPEDDLQTSDLEISRHNDLEYHETGAILAGTPHLSDDFYLGEASQFGQATASSSSHLEGVASSEPVRLPPMIQPGHADTGLDDLTLLAFPDRGEIPVIELTPWSPGDPAEPEELPSRSARSRSPDYGSSRHKDQSSRTQSHQNREVRRRDRRDRKDRHNR